MRLKPQTLLIIIIVLLISGFSIVGCTDNEPPPSKPTATSFTFLELGANTIYSKSVLDKLDNSLGSVAVAKRTPIDLDTNYPGFIEAYFPSIHHRNELLNDAAGARREHDTIKLMYRYPQEKSRLFKMVELLFSGQSKKPLYFRIVAGKEGADIIDTMREKFGAPREIKWSHQQGVSYYWEKNKDFLIVSRVIDRFGNPEYRIAIYYNENIDELIESERRQVQQYEEKRKKAGRSAF